jgi:hypothetical protein
MATSSASATGLPPVLVRHGIGGTSRASAAAISDLWYEKDPVPVRSVRRLPRLFRERVRTPQLGLVRIGAALRLQRYRISL